MTQLILYPLLTACLYYLGSRAEVTRWLWSRYPPRVGRFMACASCSGFWYGALVAIVGGYGLGFGFLDFAPRDPATVPIVGACSIVWTPVVSFAHITRLEALGGEPTAEEREIGDGEAQE